MKKLLISIAALGVVTIAGSLWWLHNSLDAQVASAIRRYGPEITGVSISLSKTTINPLDGRAALYGLVVGNPDGFKTNQALSLDEISLTLDIRSLTTDVIRIKELTLLKPAITYEYAAGGSNLDVLRRNIERAIGHNKQKAQRSESGKKLIIEHLYVKSASAHVSAELLNGEAVSLPIPDVHLQDIGKKSDGVTAGEVTNQILVSIVQQVSAAMTAAGIHTATNTIQIAVDSATQVLKGLFK
jgi:uncharacterized protein involved in outer membrane biogenesis